VFEQNVQTVIDKVDQLRETTDDHMQIPRAEGPVLAQIVRIGRCRSLLEIGVSYGFSTLHLAAACRENGGHQHSVDISEKKINAAREHLTEAGLIETVSLHLGDGREVCRSLEPAEPFDFVFIDAVKQQSREYFEAIADKLAPRCIIATDNTSTHPQLLGEFVEFLHSRPGAKGCEVPVGNGFDLTVIDRG
jgi:predicted O-methyltransferase YrrM